MNRRMCDYNVHVFYVICLCLYGSVSVKNVRSWPGEMAQWIKCCHMSMGIWVQMPNQYKKLGVTACACNPKAERQRWVGLEDYCSDSLVSLWQTVSQKKQGRWWVIEHPTSIPGLCMYTGGHVLHHRPRRHTYTYITSFYLIIRWDTSIVQALCDNYL